MCLYPLFLSISSFSQFNFLFPKVYPIVVTYFSHYFLVVDSLNFCLLSFPTFVLEPIHVFPQKEYVVGLSNLRSTGSAAKEITPWSVYRIYLCRFWRRHLVWFFLNGIRIKILNLLHFINVWYRIKLKSVLPLWVGVSYFF